MCCKVQDYEKELESMIKKIKQLATMGCWKIVKVTSLPSGAKLINRRWVYDLKFRDGYFFRASSFLPRRHVLSTRERAWLFRELLSYLLELYHSYRACTHSRSWLVCGGFVCAFISVDLALWERVCMEGPAAWSIAVNNCIYMFKYIYGLLHAPRTSTSSILHALSWSLAKS